MPGPKIDLLDNPELIQFYVRKGADNRLRVVLQENKGDRDIDPQDVLPEQLAVLKGMTAGSSHAAPGSLFKKEYATGSMTPAQLEWSMANGQVWGSGKGPGIFSAPDNFDLGQKLEKIRSGASQEGPKAPASKL